MRDKKRRNDLKNPCCAMRELFVKENEGILSEMEKESVNSHVALCPDCLEYRRILQTLAEVAQIPPRSTLEPLAQIKEVSIAKLLERGRQKPSIIQRVWDSVGGLLTYRIPAYQALAASFLILLCFLGILYSRSMPDGEPIYAREESETNQASLQTILESKYLKVGHNLENDDLYTACDSVLGRPASM